MSFSETQEFTRFDDPEYKKPKLGEEADGRKVGNLNDKMPKSENNDLKDKSGALDFKATKDFISQNAINEKRADANDHPTKVELEAQLNSFLDISPSKNSTIGGAQIAEGLNRESINT